MFVECARHVFGDDCLLGISYLLSLRVNDIEFVKPAFEEIRDPDLRIQLAAYFYSLEFYKILNPESSLGYYNDPLELIIEMRRIAESGNKDSMIVKGLLYWSSRLKNPEEREIGDKNLDDVVKKDDEIDSRVETVAGLSENVGNKFLVETEESFESNEEGWNDDWGDFSDQENDEEIKSAEDETKIEEICVNESEETRFEIFEKLILGIGGKEEFLKAKETLLSWPGFEKAEFITEDKHPALRMIQASIGVLDNEENGFSTSQRLIECKEIIEGQFLAEEVRTEKLFDSSILNI